MSETINSKRDTNYLSDEVTTLAMCWKLKLVNGNILGFTNHDQDIQFDGLTYIAKSGFSASAIASSCGLTVDNMDVDGLIDSESICEKDLLSGVYDNAEIEVFLLNYLDTDGGILKLRKGWLGEIRFNSNHFTTEIRGLLQAFTAKVCDTYSPLCRARFCDKQCKLKVEQFSTKNLEVQYVIDNSTFVFREKQLSKTLDIKQENVENASKNIYLNENNHKKLAEETINAYNNDIDNEGINNLHKIANEIFIPHEMFNNGFLTFTTGSNIGINMEIKYCQDYRINTVLSLPHKINVGDKFDMMAGCNKTFNMCCKFNNAINFRGEPHMPDPTQILQTIK